MDTHAFDLSTFKYHSQTLHVPLSFPVISFIIKFTAARRVPGLNSAWKTEKLCGRRGQWRGLRWRYSCHCWYSWISSWRHASDEERSGKMCAMPRPFIPHRKSNLAFNSKFSHGSGTCIYDSLWDRPPNQNHRWWMPSQAQKWLRAQTRQRGNGLYLPW